MRHNHPTNFILPIIGSLFFSTQVLGNPMRDLPKETKQTVLVKPIKNSPSQAEVSLFELKAGKWNQVSKPMPAVVGRKGFASIGEKREGDGKTPSGAFPIGHAFGYAKHLKLNIPYRQATETDYFIDDPESDQYNTWVSDVTSAKSFEYMKRRDNLYELGLSTIFE